MRRPQTVTLTSLPDAVQGVLALFFCWLARLSARRARSRDRLPPRRRHRRRSRPGDPRSCLERGLRAATSPSPPPLPRGSGCEAPGGGRAAAPRAAISRVDHFRRRPRESLRDMPCLRCGGRAAGHVLPGWPFAHGAAPILVGGSSACDRRMARPAGLSSACTPRPMFARHSSGLPGHLPRRRRLSCSSSRRSKTRRRAALRAAAGSACARATASGPRRASLVAAGFDVGFHTLRHELLPALPDKALSERLEKAGKHLLLSSETRLELISYPYGKADERVADAARSSGFRRLGSRLAGTRHAGDGAAPGPENSSRDVCRQDALALRLARVLHRADRVPESTSVSATTTSIRRTSGCRRSCGSCERASRQSSRADGGDCTRGSRSGNCSVGRRARRR